MALIIIQWTKYTCRIRQNVFLWTVFACPWNIEETP